MRAEKGAKGGKEGGAAEGRRIAAEFRRADKPDAEPARGAMGGCEEERISMKLASYGVRMRPGADKLGISIQEEAGESGHMPGLEIAIALGRWGVTIKVVRNENGAPSLDIEAGPPGQTPQKPG